MDDEEEDEDDDNADQVFGITSVINITEKVMLLIFWFTIWFNTEVFMYVTDKRMCKKTTQINVGLE